MFYWKVDDQEHFSADNFPVFKFSGGNKREVMMYGLPAMEYPGMIKVCESVQTVYITILYTGHFYLSLSHTHNHLLCSPFLSPSPLLHFSHSIHTFSPTFPSFCLHVQAALHTGPEVHPDHRDANPTPNTTEIVGKFIHDHFKGVSTTPSIYEACLYTVSLSINLKCGPSGLLKLPREKVFVKLILLVMCLRNFSKNVLR